MKHYFKRYYQQKTKKNFGLENLNLSADQSLAVSYVPQDHDPQNSYIPDDFVMNDGGDLKISALTKDYFIQSV